MVTKTDFVKIGRLRKSEAVQAMAPFEKSRSAIVSIDGKPAGRIVMGLFGNAVPKVHSVCLQ